MILSANLGYDWALPPCVLYSIGSRGAPVFFDYFMNFNRGLRHFYCLFLIVWLHRSSDLQVQRDREVSSVFVLHAFSSIRVMSATYNFLFNIFNESFIMATLFLYQCLDLTNCFTSLFRKFMCFQIGLTPVGLLLYRIFFSIEFNSFMNLFVYRRVQLAWSEKNKWKDRPNCEGVLSGSPRSIQR